MTTVTVSPIQTFPGPDGRTYEIRERDTGRLVVLFLTNPEPGDGRSADEVAVGNLTGWSVTHPGCYSLVYLPPANVLDVGCPDTLLAEACDGVAWLLVDLDDISSDVQHAGPLGWVAEGAAMRRSLHEPTQWGQTA